ncbi:NAD-dependent epimerase/dehydratase family protein [Lysobacter sp. F60174L2]|uniref:NAD-dependent epimerase/dehydratase family protein n=1 Tax=Lysobacter sp. F60174L2 TaxID=3459295 RepID=UPI00403DC731
MREALVFGGSGQVGRPVIGRLRAAGWQVTALSRRDQPGADGLRWRVGDFDAMPTLPKAFEAIISCGPLDRFGRWYAGADVVAPRVVAFGSTSIETKQVSADASERDLVRRLGEGERNVFETARSRDAAATLLRPTLVYGSGRDASLTRIAQLAHRWHRFPLPRGATGLRQPVHVDDLADAAMRCLDQPASFGHAYAVPGGETLPYREMVARVLAALQPPAQLIELPPALFGLVLRVAQATGRARGLGGAAVARMQDDLVFDATPARDDFGYAPRRFQPTAEMFDPARAGA